MNNLYNSYSSRIEYFQDNIRELYNEFYSKMGLLFLTYPIGYFFTKEVGLVSIIFFILWIPMVITHYRGLQKDIRNFKTQFEEDIEFNSTLLRMNLHI